MTSEARTYFTAKQILGGVALVAAVAATIWMGASRDTVTASTSPPVDSDAITTCLEKIGATVVVDEFDNVGAEESSPAVDECLAMGYEAAEDNAAVGVSDLSAEDEAVIYDTFTSTLYDCIEAAGYDVSVSEDGISWTVDPALYDQPKYLAAERACVGEAEQTEADLRAELAQ